MNRKHDYPGELGAPMEPIWYGLLEMDNQLKIANAQRVSEMLRRMHLLARHFGFDPNNQDQWFGVALRLAIDHVPGLSVRDPRIKSGAEKVWERERLALLVFEMNREIESGLHIKQAAQKLSQRRPWKKLVKGKKDSGEALRAMFTRSRRRKDLSTLLELYKIVSRTYLDNNDPQAWEASLHHYEEPIQKFNYV